MRHIAFATSLICGLLGYTDAFGQGFWYLPPGGDYSDSYGFDLGNGFGYGVGYGYGYGLANSPEAAAASAYGDLVRFHGQYGVTEPQATVSGADVYGAGATSQQKYNAAYETKQQHTLKLERAKAEKEARKRLLEERASLPRTVESWRLSASEFETTTGEVQWPSALSQESFAVQRAEIESLLKSRVKVGTTGDLDACIVKKTQELHQELREKIRQIPAKEYLEGRKFLNRLAVEAQLPVS